MLRLLVPLGAIVAAALSGCAVGGANMSSGFADNPASKPSSASFSTANRGALGGEPPSSPMAGRGVQVASAKDVTPAGDYEKAPKGALADRDYGGAKLDVENARDLINSYRQSHHLKPLKLNAALTDAAKAHSRDLAKWDRISHYGSDGSNPWDRVKRVGYNAKVAAENVGTGQASIAEVMKGWEESAAHNKNLLLPDVEHMGIALVADPKTEFKTFWTLVLAASN